MKKEEILAKNRQDNRDGDEHYKQAFYKGYAVSAIIGALLCMLICIVKNVLNENDDDVFIIWSVMEAISSFFLYRGSKKKFYLINACICSAGAVGCIINYVIYILENI